MGLEARVYSIIADGRSGSNRNLIEVVEEADEIIADGRSGSNRNFSVEFSSRSRIIADGRSGSNRNVNSLAMSRM